jgi:hypothetical protein
MSLRILALASLLVSFPAAAFAAPLTIGGVFADASGVQKAIMATLLLATLGSVAVTVMKLASEKVLSGGSAFVAGLRLGGPIIGALGAAYSAIEMSIGLANAAVVPSLKVLAPGFAETTLMLGFGCLTGAVAVVAHWAIESRIDRQVLGA